MKAYLCQITIPVTIKVSKHHQSFLHCNLSKNKLFNRSKVHYSLFKRRIYFYFLAPFDNFSDTIRLIGEFLLQKVETDFVVIF